MPFIDLMEIMQFSLDHAVIKMPDGKLKRQVKGIPMGDNISPGETVIACAWMENEFMGNLQEEKIKNILQLADTWMMSSWSARMKQAGIVIVSKKISQMGAMLHPSA